MDFERVAEQQTQRPNCHERRAGHDAGIKEMRARLSTDPR